MLHEHFTLVIYMSRHLQSAKKAI